MNPMVWGTQDGQLPGHANVIVEPRHVVSLKAAGPSTAEHGVSAWIAPVPDHAPRRAEGQAG